MPIVVVGNDLRRRAREAAEPPEHVLGVAGVGEVVLQLVVDRLAGRDDEVVSDAALRVEIGDESPHQPRLADARGERERDGRKRPLEVRAGRVERTDALQACRKVAVLRGVDRVADRRQALQRGFLRLAQAQPPGDVGDVVFVAEPFVNLHRRPPPIRRRRRRLRRRRC